MDQLTRVIVDIREKLEQDAFDSEEEVATGVVRRLFHELGWDTFDTSRMTPEFRVENGRVDFALQHATLGPVIFVEVKRVGNATAKGEDQLFSYCVKRGVMLAVFTDGRSWSFYLPAGHGTQEQRRFARFDLVDDEAATCGRLLRRYLECASVDRGQAHKDARADYDRHWERIVARQHFERAFESLFTEGCEGIVSSFCEEVRKRCEFSPDQMEAAQFLTKAIAAEVNESPDRTHLHPVSPPTTSSSAEIIPAAPTPATGVLSICAYPSQEEAPFQEESTAVVGGALASSASFCFRGQDRCVFRENVNLMRNLFAEFVKRYPNFCEKYAERRKRVGSRIEIGRQKEDFPESRRKKLYPLPGGWWISIRGNKREQKKMIERACEVVGIEFGRDLSVTFK